MRNANGFHGNWAWGQQRCMLAPLSPVNTDRPQQTLLFPGLSARPFLRFFHLTFPSLIAPSHTPPPLSGRESSPSIFQCWSVKKWKRRREMDCGGTNDCLQVKNRSGNHSSTLSSLGPKEDQSLITSGLGQKLNWKSKHEYKREWRVTTRYSCWWWMGCAKCTEADKRARRCSRRLNVCYLGFLGAVHPSPCLLPTRASAWPQRFTFPPLNQRPR